MTSYKFDVIIVGAGPAGVTAAGALAGSGISTALIEAGVYAGAENWSGCVYFAECLAETDCFGPAAVQSAPFERHVVRRGTLVHNGLDVVGLSLTDPAAFGHCYTVLRPVYDPYFAHLARSKGAVLLTGTTVLSLIRNNGRVTGVQTSRGPLFAEAVFLAEGDASHLVRSEGLERVPDPHYLQGVKAVLNLPAAEIGKRFNLNEGEGAAFEILVRNASIAGRTARLNVGGFLYTNRDSLSLGYVVPLDNLKKHYRGDHSFLLEWMKSLPHISDLVKDARLSAYGTKIVRGGGWNERPALVEDGLAVGGASVGLGVDIPFPNFTGPASATGLFFARAVRTLLRDGKSLDARNLTEAYLIPLRGSVYGKNAHYLSRWPAYFGRSSVLFGRTADMICGTAHFLSKRTLVDAGRFLRGHLLSVRGLGETVSDTVAALGALRLWKPIAATLLSPSTFGKWALNQVRRKPEPDGKLDIIMNIGGKKADAASLPWPLGGLLQRISPALSRAAALVYANDGMPAERKFSEAVRTMIRSFRLSDFIVLPLFAANLLFLSLATALWDAFRYYVLKTPAEKLLAEPVMAYNHIQRKMRDLDAVKPPLSLEAKLALNTYRVGSASHIRTLWPEKISSQPDMAQASLWWVCPARVYMYDAPLAGRGKVTVNFENCIKCETCWRAEPGVALWGRFTDHKLIYRPESAAIPVLLDSLRSGTGVSPVVPPQADEKLWYATPAMLNAARSALNAAAAFREAVHRLPASADKTRRQWPLRIGERMCGRIARLEAVLSSDGRADPALELAAERKSLELKLSEGSLFHALYCVARLEQRLFAWLPELPLNPPAPPFVKERHQENPPLEKGDRGGFEVSYEEVSKLFPDRIVKEWEEKPIPEEWTEKLQAFVQGHLHPSRPAVRALSSVSPALGLIAACQMRAARLLQAAGRDLLPGLCAVDADGVEITQAGRDVVIKGPLSLVPTAASSDLLLVNKDKGYLIPLSSPGVSVTPTPAIGFRAARLAEIALDCAVGAGDVIAVREAAAQDPAAYLAIALGAGDYLSKRAREYAAGRVQFPGQMLDTEGRDGIAKLGAVKALVARTEAWRLLLETLYEAIRVRAAHSPSPFFSSPPGESSAAHEAIPLFSVLCAAASAMAYGPEAGAMAYDAGQVFGGFAYSEDDLLSRFYRDSSLFRFLAPGPGAAAKLHTALSGKDLDREFSALIGTIDGVASEPLAGPVRRWGEIRKGLTGLPQNADPSAAGEASALLIGIRALLARVETGLEAGGSMEPEAAAAEVLLSLAEDAVEKARLSAGRGSVSSAAVFPIAPAGDPVELDMDYEAFCGRPAPPHRSGNFLVTAFDRSPRYVPEMQLHDPERRRIWNELADWFRRNCRDKSYDGLAFERYVEKIHDLPPEIIDAVKKNKWLATYIPKSEDGLGWRKADYYILNSAAGSFGDAAACLLVMANTSIGTTPILLGLEDELPRVREELEPLLKDERRLGEISGRIRRIIATFKNPNPAWIRKEYESVMGLVDLRIRHTRVIKYLAANFLKAFYGAGIAGRRGDFGGFTSGLAKAADLFDRIMPDVRSAVEELPRRERCHRLYLRALGHGAVSAFALTEPTAGSDSGGVKTTAAIKTAMLSPLPDGRYGFSPTGEFDKCLRYLVDADRIVFTGDGMAYLTPDDKPAPVRFDRYDYASDQGARYYEYQGNQCEFHDIGQVRRAGAGLVYEYYSVTGAKMWITNGKIATQFCLYAQSAEGVTGFIVDRHAEGLKVGADEMKTGQRGSPTNEISLDNVRVPREAVIGYEGHGQVNALEALNVGRCGLAAVSGALMRKVMDESARNVPPSAERDALLGEAAAVIFGSESLAYYLIGLFDRPHESVRMESAVAKYACSEDIHEVLSLVERAYGPSGQTEKYLLEKARRDARILNIYEGTNEVQRFLILKDLVALAPDWPGLPEKLPGREDPDAETLAYWKNRLRGHVKAARELLGDAAWSDAMLQPSLFLLADMAGETLRLECILYRVEWLCARAGLLGRAYVDPLTEAGKRASERARARLEHLERKYRAAWEQTAANLSAPEVRAADAALDRMEEKPAAAAVMPIGVSAPLRILCILRPVAELSPDPRMENGALREIVWTVDPLDLSGLDQALALRAASGPDVTVHALLTGGPEHEPLLRSAAACADGLFRLDGAGHSATDIAEAVRELEHSAGYDLIVTGSTTLEDNRSLDAFLAGRLKRSHAAVDLIRLKSEHAGVPVLIGVTKASAAAESDIGSLVEASARGVTVLRPGAESKAKTPPLFVRPMAAAAAVKTMTTVRDAADYLKEYAAALSSGAAPDYGGAVPEGELYSGPAVWAVLDPINQKENLSALRASRIAADLFGKKACALVVAPGKIWPSLIGLAKANGADTAYCVDTRGALTEEGRRLVTGLVADASGTPAVIAGKHWSSALAFVAGGLTAGKNGPQLAARITGITKDPEGYLLVSSPVYDGKLIRREPVRDGAAFLTVSEEAELPTPGERGAFEAFSVSMDLKPDWTVPLPPPAEPALSQAEVIIDLGYGIRDKSGMELATELRKKLEALGLAPLFGATRKVTQDLKLLPLETQIGQTGVRVNPKLIIALGISGAPQHIDWLGTRAEILCFNKDPEAPLVKLNQTRPAPRVHPIPGDLFVTVRELIEKLG